MVPCVSTGSITHSVAIVGNTSAETWKRHISATFSYVSANVNLTIYDCGNTCFLKLKHDENMNKKWSGSAVYAATETGVNVTKPLTETQVIRRVSGTVSHVSATFPFTDSWNFVL